MHDLELERVKRLQLRNEKMQTQTFNKHQMSLTTQRMLLERQESHKLDPRPLKAKPKKNTYGRGWHGEDDGRATVEEMNKMNPSSMSNDNGGLLKNLFVR